MANVTGIHQLALFICHLFIDGHFRTAHFVYKPNTFEFDWLLQMDAICPEPIPLYLSDITLPWEWPWNDKDTLNNVLQLNFFDMNNNLADDVDQLQESCAYYRVFCFPSTNLPNAEQRSFVFSTLRPFCDSNILLVDYNTKNVSTFIDSNYDSNWKSSQEPIVIVSDETEIEHANLFDRTFGEYERMQSIAIQRALPPSQLEQTTYFPYVAAETIWMHYYHLRLRSSIINVTWFDNRNYPFTVTDKQCLLQVPDHYKEFSHTYQCIENGNL